MSKISKLSPLAQSYIVFQETYMAGEPVTLDAVSCADYPLFDAIDGGVDLLSVDSKFYDAAIVQSFADSIGNTDTETLRKELLNELCYVLEFWDADTVAPVEAEAQAVAPVEADAVAPVEAEAQAVAPVEADAVAPVEADNLVTIEGKQWIKLDCKPTGKRLEVADKFSGAWYIPADFQETIYDQVSALSNDKLRDTVEFSGKTRNVVKLEQEVKNLVAVAVRAVATGQKRKEVVQHYANLELNKFVMPNGDVHYAPAIRTVCGVEIDYTFETLVNSAGKETTKRSEWIKLGEYLQQQKMLVGKTGKPSPLAKKAEKALETYNYIQGVSEANRAKFFAAKKLTA
jgi:hypothetical protein